jgi:hypothetical protein
VYARVRWQRQGGLAGILGGTSSLRPHGWTRDNGEPAVGEKILIRNGVVVVVDETGQPRSLLVLKRSVAAVECK